MKKISKFRLRPFHFRGLTALCLAVALLLSYPSTAFATDGLTDESMGSEAEMTASHTASQSSSAETSEEDAGIQAFWDFFGPDGVNDCLEADSQQTDTSFDDLIMTVSDQQAVLTTVWENVGGGRINRKYLNGLVAFCYDEELAFPSGAIYRYASADDAAVSGQVAAIAQRFGRSGVDNAQWWSECQVAIWAVRAGCRSYDSAAAFARSYCADRKITDPATVEDYAYIVGTLVTETAGASGTAYLYQAEDPANQRILTYLAVWPNPAPSSPSPKYDQVSATENAQATRQHSISLDHKAAAITGEALAGVVFTVYEDGKPVGTITTDSQGRGSCQWQLTETASATITKEYCSNYDKLDPETRKTITGYTNREDAYTAARKEAQAEAKQQAEKLADRTHTVTLEETTIPTGFSATIDSSQTVTLTGNDSAIFSALNLPWSATLLIQKADGTTGQPIPGDTVFTLYEWNGSEYEVSPHYQIVRREDGIYHPIPIYTDGEPGQLYYTQQNQGKFALAENQAPHGYVPEEEWFYFQITEDQQTIWGHNAHSDRYPLTDDTKFFNQAVNGTILITKTGDYLTGAESTDHDPEFFGENNTEFSGKDEIKQALVNTQFQYTAYPVTGTIFAIYAAEDILQPGGSDQIASYQGILLYQGTLVATVTTDTTGVARLDGLPLGTYEIREIQPGQGDFLLDPKVTTVTLSYQDPSTPVVMDDSTHYHNQRQQFSVTVCKQNRALSDVLADLSPQLSSTPQSEFSLIADSLSEETLASQLPLSGAVFGLYTAEDIYGYVWDEASGTLVACLDPLIPADTLVETIVTDEKGQAFFQADLPCGSYYIRELTPPVGYLLSDEIYRIDASYGGSESEPVVSFTHTFYNDPVCLTVTKIDGHKQTPLAGAHLSLYLSLGDSQEDEGRWALAATWTSEEIPKLLWAMLPGRYRLVETQAPQGYEPAEPLEFTIAQDVPLTTVTLENTPIPPQDPTVPTSSGAPTGDDSPLAMLSLCLLGSLLVMILLRKRSSVQKACHFFNYHV